MAIQVFDNATLGDELESIQGTQLAPSGLVTLTETLANFVPDLSGLQPALSVCRCPADGPRPAGSGGDRGSPELLNAQGFHLVTFFSAGAIL